MHQRKGKKILFYLFLLLIVGSINNNSLSKIQFEKIKNIKISGLSEKENTKLLENIKKLNLENIFLIKRNQISEIINSNNLIENYEIFKKYPDSINIKIEKTNFLAKISRNGKIFLVGSNGKLSDIKFSDRELPFIFGDLDISEFLKLKKKIDNSLFEFSEISNLYLYKSNRWDIETRSGNLIKLPKNNVKEILDLYVRMSKEKKINKKIIIDFRQKNQIILNE